jgi:hypothetical protein
MTTGVRLYLVAGYHCGAEEGMHEVRDCDCASSHGEKCLEVYPPSGTCPPPRRGLLLGPRPCPGRSLPLSIFLVCHHHFEEGLSLGSFSTCLRRRLESGDDKCLGKVGSLVELLGLDGDHQVFALPRCL